MCMIGDEFITVLSDTKPRAKKPHRCEECRRVIEPGEQYERTAGTFEGEFETHKTCLQCVAVREWLRLVCSGWIYGAVGEDLRDHFNEGYGFWLGRAVVGMRRRWRRRDGALMAPLTLPADIPAAA